MNQKKYVLISEKVAKKLNRYLEEFCKTHPEFNKISKEYTNKRIHFNGIQFYAGFKVSGTTENFEKFCGVAIAIECIMLRAYKTNKILDHKQHVWGSKEKIEETLLDEGTYLSLVFELIRNSKKTLGKKYQFIFELIINLICNIGKAFLIEQTELKASGRSLKEILGNWEYKYQKRNNLGNSLYDYAPLIGYYLGSGNEKIFEKFEKYFQNKIKISHSGQILNDLSDCSSICDENVKSYQDAFSDIKNKIITQPVFELINFPQIQKALQNPELTKDQTWRGEIINLLINEKIFDKIKKITNLSYSQNISFWRDLVGIDSELLLHTYSFLIKNKYYQKFCEYQIKNENSN